MCKNATFLIFIQSDTCWHENRLKKPKIDLQFFQKYGRYLVDDSYDKSDKEYRKEKSSTTLESASLINKDYREMLNPSFYESLSDSSFISNRDEKIDYRAEMKNRGSDIRNTKPAFTWPKKNYPLFRHSQKSLFSLSPILGFSGLFSGFLGRFSFNPQIHRLSH